MSRRSSEKRIEAIRRNAQESTGPRSTQNAVKHGLSSIGTNPLSPGCFLKIEDETAFQGMLNEYMGTYQPNHRDELDLLTEAVYAKFRQQRVWIAETGQIEVAIAQNERDLRVANASAHLANGMAHCENMLKLYLRYDTQLHRHYKSCLQQLQDLQARRIPESGPDDPTPIEAKPSVPIEPKPAESPEPPPVATSPDEPIAEKNPTPLTPEQARLAYMKAEIKRFDDLQSRFNPSR